MEVVVDTSPGYAPPEDTFISMRIGDVQKQSRLTASRTYRFPDPGEGKGHFGRIEIFQRVGHVTIGFDSDGKYQDVEIPCQFSQGLGRLGLKVAAKGVSNMDAIGMEKKKHAKERLDAAQAYLEQYHLEELLADAMREVIKQRPSDPHRLLSNIINARAGQQQPSSASFLPPLPDASKKSPPDAPPMDNVAGAAAERAPKASPEPLETMKSVPPGEKLPPIKAELPPKDSAAPEKQKLFREYYLRNVRLAPDAGFAAMYSKFAKYRAATLATDKPTPASAETAATQGTAVQELPPKDSGAVEKVFREYYLRNVRLAPESAFAAMHGKFTKRAPVDSAAPEKHVEKLFREYYLRNVRLAPESAFAAMHGKFTKRAPVSSAAPEKQIENVFREYYLRNVRLAPEAAFAAMHGKFTKRAPVDSAAPEKHVEKLFREYYLRNVRLAPESAFAAMHGKFTKRAPVDSAAPEKHVEKVFREYYLRNVRLAPESAFAAMHGKFTKRAPVDSAAPEKHVEKLFHEYYLRNVRLAPESAFAAMHGKFTKRAPVHKQAAIPFYMKPSAGTWFQRMRGPAAVASAGAAVPSAAVAAATSTSIVTAPKTPFNMLPSTGSWLQVRFSTDKKGPAELQGDSSIVETAAQTKADTQVSFHLLPSVGTWCARRPARTAAKEEDVSVVAAAPVKIRFDLKPSVGTWLTRLAPRSQGRDNEIDHVQEVIADQTDTDFKFLASVGSWLQVPSPRAAQGTATSPVFDVPNTQLLQMEKPKLIDFLHDEVARRDALIEELKAKLGM